MLQRLVEEPGHEGVLRFAEEVEREFIRPLDRYLLHRGLKKLFPVSQLLQKEWQSSGQVEVFEVIRDNLVFKTLHYQLQILQTQSLYSQLGVHLSKSRVDLQNFILNDASENHFLGQWTAPQSGIFIKYLHRLFVRGSNVQVLLPSQSVSVLSNLYDFLNGPSERLVSYNSS